MKWSDYKNKKFENPEFKEAYDELEKEYSDTKKFLNSPAKIKSKNLKPALNSLQEIFTPSP